MNTITGRFDPARAVALYETFLAGCYEKVEELDDSSGSFGQFVDGLFCGWMDDDPYGFCYHLERNAAKVLDKKGLSAGYDLARVKRQLLVKLGRGNEALEAAWADYCRHPSKYTYDDLMKYVPKAKRPMWHGKAMEASEGADLHSCMELLLETKELGRLAGLVRRSKDSALEDLSHFITEPAARRLEKTHPDVAARLWRAQGMRIVQAKKSKYYEAALLNFERAKARWGGRQPGDSE